MSKNLDKNFQTSAKELAQNVAPFIPTPSTQTFNLAETEVKIDDLKNTPLIDKDQKTTTSPHPILNIPQTNFASLLKSQDSGKPKGFFARFTSPITKLMNKFGETRVGKLVPWLTSKGMIKVINFAVPAFAFTGLTALSGGIVPMVALGIAGASIIFNTIREVYSLRGKKDLAEEHKLLQEYKAAQNASAAGLDFLKKQKNIDFRSSQSALDTAANIKSKFKSKYENNLTMRPLRKIIQSGLFEASGNIALTAVVATSGLANAAMHAMSVGATAGIFTAVDIALTLRENKKVNIIKNALRKDIDEMRQGVPKYDNLEELRKITRAQKIETETIKQVLRQDIRQLDATTVKERILEAEKIAEARPEFALPAPKNLWGKTKGFFKDVVMVNFPNNDYYSADKYAASRDRVKESISNHYGGVAKEIQTTCNREVPTEHTHERTKSFIESERTQSISWQR